MILTITHGAYGFFSPYRRRKYVVECAEDLATVFRNTSALFNSDRDPWGLEIINGDDEHYMWAPDDADEVWQSL